VTYRWNSAQTEADLVPEEGANETISINDNGTIRSQTWRYPSRAECLQCHTSAGGLALGFNTAQLNRNETYGSTTANQLTALANAGYFTGSIPAPSTLRALAAADDSSATLEHRARSYLASNCVQCHQPGGTALGNFDARIQTATANAGLINGALVDSGGDAANRVVVAGDTAHSMLLSRINRRGGGQMPPVASNEIDPSGVTLLTNWINGLGTSTPAPTITSQPVNQTVSTGHAVTFYATASGGTGLVSSRASMVIGSRSADMMDGCAR
jgi:mono/diheme cytochrome c family protein